MAETNEKPVTLEEKYPPNSYSQISAKEPVKKPAKTDKVAQGHIVKKKKTLKEKIREIFPPIDWRSVIEGIVYDVLLPGAKYTARDMLESGVRGLFGEKSDVRTSRNRGRTYVRTDYDYDRCYDDSRYGRRPKPESYRPAPRQIVEEMGYRTKNEAIEVLHGLKAQIDEYDSASVNDLYSFSNMPTDYTKRKYGWYNLDEAYVERDEDGFVLKLPKPQVID